MQSSAPLFQSSASLSDSLSDSVYYSHALDPNFATDVYNNFDALNDSEPTELPFVPQAVLQPLTAEAEYLPELDHFMKESIDGWVHNPQSDFEFLQDPSVQQILAGPSAALHQPALPASSSFSSSKDSHEQPKLLKSAIHLFEANVRFNENRASGILPWLKLLKVAKHKGLANADVQQTIDWSEAASDLSYSDFHAFYRRQRKLARTQNVFLPTLPAWIVESFFDGQHPQEIKRGHPSQLPMNASRVLVERSLNRGAAASSGKGKGKARAAPYHRLHASGGVA